jgi:signal transduction histidine kinase
VTELAAGVRSRNGQRTDVALVYSVVRSPEMLPLNAVVNVRDMTRMRETEDMRSAFLSMLGHQLQTPLAIIKGYTNTLSRTDADWDSGTLRRIFEAIEEETDHMSQLMNRLLLASRLETGELPINLEQVQLSALAQKAVGRLQPGASNHDFSVQFPDDLPTVSGDPGLLEEVIMNLLDNAVKYSPDGGSIEVLVDADTAVGVTLTVKDQGVGVPRWETRRIFERFHRSQHPVSVQTRGMGIGLYICDAVMTAHGGAIHVESAPGMGSSFTLTFPEAVVSR